MFAGHTTHRTSGSSTRATRCVVSVFLIGQAGIGIWEETLGPSVSVSDLTNPYFMKYQLQAVSEMMDASMNHPSVFMHGFYNEGPRFAIQSSFFMVL